jgi:hypothetical protein
MALENETKYYESISAQLLSQSEGKFALIIGSELLGVFDRPETAYAKGIEVHGNVPMLIQPITRQERVETIPAMVLGLISAHL